MPLKNAGDDRCPKPMRCGTKMTGGSPLLRPGMITAIASPSRLVNISQDDVATDSISSGEEQAASSARFEPEGAC